MSLRTVSNDSLRTILELLPGKDICKLLFCGSKTLSTRVLASCAELKFKLDHFSRFPRITYEFPLLQALDVSIDTGLELSYPIGVNEAGLWPKEPLESLTALRFAFSQTSSICDGARLAASFPNLKELYLANATSFPAENPLQGLPDTLTKLELRSSFVSSNEPLRLDKSATLPHNLTYLCFHMRVEIHRDVEWPPRLSTLFVAPLTAHRQFFRYLPPILEELDVGRLEFLEESDNEALATTQARSIFAASFAPSSASTSNDLPDDTPGTDELPKTLLRFRVQLSMSLSGRYLPNLQLRLPLPPNLLLFSAKLPFTRVTSEEFTAALPRSMQFCGLCTKVEMLGPMATEAQIYGDEMRLENLPPTLKVLELMYTRLSPEWSLPEKLTRLGGFVAHGESTLARLPRQLKHLRLRPGPTLSTTAWNQLPSTLVGLTISAHCFEGTDFLQNLPSLRQLSLQNIEAHNLNPFIKRLPLSITSLELTTNEPVKADLEKIVGNFAELLQLSTLDIQGPPSYEPTEYSILPPNLRILRISPPTGPIDIDSFAKLPASLKQLELRSWLGGPSPNPLSDNHMSCLPRGLQVLSVAHKLGKFTERVWDVIPPSIALIMLTPNLPAYRDRYYANPFWQGTRMPASND